MSNDEATTPVPVMTAAQWAAVQAASTALTGDAATLASAVAAIAANTPVVTPPPVVLSTQPTGLAWTSPAAGQLGFSWVTPAAGQPSGGYDVMRSGFEADGKTSKDWHTTITKDQTSFLFGNLGAGSVHTMTVTPLPADGKSAASIDGTVQGSATTTPPPVVTPPPVTGATLPFAVGVWLTGNGTDYAGYDNWLGHPTVFADAFQYRPDEATMCSMSASDGPIGGGKIPVASFQCIIQGGSETRNGISAATVQARAVKAGKALVAKGALGAQAVIRIMTEANNPSSGDPGCNVWDPNSVADYVKCFHAASVGFRSVAGQHFTLLADVSFDAGNNADLRIMLDAVMADCDGFGLDIYNAAVPWGSPFTNEADQWSKRYNGVNGGIGYKAYLDLARANNKWVFIPECGLGYFYDNNGAAQTPPDANSVFYQQLIAALSDPTLKVGGVCMWEDNNGLYLTGGQNLPNSTAAFKSTFGSKPSAAWPR